LAARNASAQVFGANLSAKEMLENDIDKHPVGRRQYFPHMTVLESKAASGQGSAGRIRVHLPISDPLLPRAASTFSGRSPDYVMQGESG
jgi:hypothetical protein